MQVIISKEFSWFFLLVLPFCKPPGASENAVMNIIYDSLFILCSVIIVLTYVKEKIVIPNFLKINAILQIYIFIRTFYVCGFDASVFRNTIGVIFATLTVYYGLKKNEVEMTRAIITIVSIYSIINLLIGYETIFETSFLGPRTSLTTIGSIMILTTYVVYLRNKNRFSLINFIITLCCNLWMILKLSVSTALVTLLISYLLFYFLRYRLNRKIHPVITIVGLTIINFAAVIIQNFSFMQFFLEDILGENLTFSGRFGIWTEALKGFLNKPIWGYGYRQLSLSRGKFATPTTYSHENILQICLDGGSIALLLFLIFMIYAIKNTDLNNRYSRFGYSAVVGIMVAMISEIFTSYNYFYIFLVLIYFYNYIDKEKQIEFGN